MSRVIRTFLFSGVLAFAAPSQASAALIVNFEQVGGNVEMTLSGSVNLDATQGSLGSNDSSDQLIEPGQGIIRAGEGDSLVYSILLIGMAEWTPFGNGGVSLFSTSVGDRIILAGDGNLGLPAGYVSGAALSTIGSFNSATFASLGLTPGSSVATFSNNGTNQGVSDSVTVNVGAAPVPVAEPATLSLLGLGLAGAAVRRFRKRT